MITLAYWAADNHIYFANENDIVLKSRKIFKREDDEAVHKMLTGERYEYEIFGVKPRPQYFDVYRLVQTIHHPQDCNINVEATINLLRYRLIHKNLLQNLRQIQ